MTKLTLEQQELLFANDCKLINLRYEYHGYTGTEKWAIVTELAEEELWVKYPDVIRRYTPFILLSMAQGEVITEYQNYEAKENYTYDRSSYIIAVYIKNGENGKLVPQVIAEKNDGKKCGELMFYNSYNKRNI